MKDREQGKTRSSMKRAFKILAGTIFGLPLLYLLSYGPAVYWVRYPILSTHTAAAFDDYDWRLSRYVSFYAPVRRMFCDLYGRTPALDKYQALFHRSIQTPQGFVLGGVYLERSSFDKISGLPPAKAVCDANYFMEEEGVASRLNGQTFDKGYAYYLPRNEMLVACGEPLLIDLMRGITMDGPRVEGSPLLP